MDCAICHSSLNKNHVRVLNLNKDAGKLRRLKCNHIFHRVCINEWAGIGNSCPICRRVINPKKVIRRISLPQSSVDALNFAHLLGVEVLDDSLSNEEIGRLDYLDIMEITAWTLSKRVASFLHRKFNSMLNS